MSIDLDNDSGPRAYLAALHAAQALIFEKTGRVVEDPPRHGLFLRLVAGETRVDRDLRTFLSEGYKLKATADYEVGPDAGVLVEEAVAAIDTAARLSTSWAICLT